MAYRFGPFRVDSQREQLFRGDRPVPLNRKAMRLLMTLIERHGEVVTKEELLSKVWPRGATANNLSQHVFMLRSALGDAAGSERYLLTVPSVGYRFVAPLDRGETESAEHVMARDYCEIAREFRERRTLASLERAVDLYQRALDYDRHCVQAHSGTALCRLFLAEYLFESPREMLAMAEEDALRALEIERNDPVALLVLARTTAQLRFRWTDAETLLLDAVRSRPEYLGAHLLLVEHYVACGRFTNAHQALSHARALGVQDEAFPRMPLVEGMVQYFERSYESARASLSALVDEYPGYAFAHMLLAKTLLVQGCYEQGLEHAQKAARVDFDPLRPGQPNVRRNALALAVHANSLMGDAAGVREAATALDAQTADLPPSSFCAAIIALAYGRDAQALRALESAVANRESMTSYIAVEPLLEPLHALPGWRSLLHVMNLTAS